MKKNIFACIICCMFTFFNLISCDTHPSSETTVFTQDILYLKSSDVLLSEDFEDIICIDKKCSDDIDFWI